MRWILFVLTVIGCSLNAQEFRDKVELFFDSNIRIDREQIKNLLAEHVSQVYYRVNGKEIEYGEEELQGRDLVMDWLEKGLFSKADTISVLSVNYDPIDGQEAFTCETYITYHDRNPCFFRDATQFWFNEEGLIEHIVKKVEKNPNDLSE